MAPLRDELFTPEALTIFTEETTRLLAERNRQREPELGRVQRQLQRVEGEIANIMKAIRKGVDTTGVKAELEKAEGERQKLQEALKRVAVKQDKVVTLLPRVAERYRSMIEGLGLFPLST